MYSCPSAAASRSKIATLARARSSLTRAQLAKRTYLPIIPEIVANGAADRTGGEYIVYIVYIVYIARIYRALREREESALHPRVGGGLPGREIDSRWNLSQPLLPNTRQQQQVHSDDRIIVPITNGNQARRPNCNVLPARIPTRQRAPSPAPPPLSSASVP
jgi:hypothetical protein